MKLNELEILENDFDLFVALDAADKIEFLFDASDVGLEAAAIKQVCKLAEKYSPDQQEEPIISVQDFEIGDNRLCVTQYPNVIHLNSDSLRAIRDFVDKLFNDGILLTRKPADKTEFDMYRFLRVYEIIGKVSPFCDN